MSVIDTLITDRDINTFYNASDLNRVGEAIQYIADKIYALGYEIHVSPKTNWVEADIPLPNQMTHYLEDLRTIRAVLAQPQRTPPVPPDMEQFLYTEANDIETMLSITDSLIEWMVSIFFFTGDLFAGEVT